MNTMQLELPRINVLSKMDLFIQHSYHKELPLNLQYYTDLIDIDEIMEHLNTDTDTSSNSNINTTPSTNKYQKLNHFICELIHEYGLVNFSTLNIKDKSSNHNEGFPALLFCIIRLQSTHGCYSHNDMIVIVIMIM